MKKIRMCFKMPDVISEAIFDENCQRERRGESPMSEAEANDWYERCSRVVKGGEYLYMDIYENGRYEVVL